MKNRLFVGFFVSGRQDESFHFENYKPFQNEKVHDLNALNSPF